MFSGTKNISDCLTYPVEERKSQVPTQHLSENDEDGMFYDAMEAL